MIAVKLAGWTILAAAIIATAALWLAILTGHQAEVEAGLRGWWT